MSKIYVSSTFIDLQNYRTQVERVIRRMGHEDVAMEYYVAEDQRPVDKCLSDVAACDLYIGIFAWRYGWIPKKNNRKKLSITEMEYRQAEKTGKPCLIFLLDGKAPWPPDFIDDDKTQIKRLRNELSEKHSTGPGFKSVDELRSLVVEAIHKWEKEHGYIQSASSIPEYNLDAYYQALRKRYQTLALEGLTPPQKEEYLQIHLRSVFVEQNVRESPPPVELPKEMWEKLKHDKDIHPEDLPSGISFDDVRTAREVYYEKPSRPVLDVLTNSNQQHTIILGDPGSGKSTLARYIMLSLIDPSTSLRAGPTGDEKFRHKLDGYLPLLIELRTYVGLCLENRCETPLEFFEHLGKTEGWALTKDALHQYLKNDGRSVVIFDGLDEIFDSEQRERVTHQIVGFANDYPKTRIIVTSRILGYRRKILSDAGFTHFTLQDLDEKQVETFVNRWYDLAMSDRPDEAKERKERILKSFKESPSIRQLAGNPMLLTIMAIIGKHQELPRERWKLYDHAASVLIQHWDVNKHLKDVRIDADFIGEDDKKELLRRLAFKMQGGEGALAGNYIHRDQLHAEFENYLIERYSQTPDRAKAITEAMIQQFRERNFILSLYGANLYGFVHRAFLEFFCASAFKYKFAEKQDIDIEYLKLEVYGRHWEDQSWHEVLRLICGMIDEKWVGELIDYLTNELYQSWPAEFLDRLPWNIALAINCIGEVRNVRTIDSIIQNVIDRMLELLEYGLFSDFNLQNFIHEHILPGVLNIKGSFPNGQYLVLWISRLNHFLKFEKWFDYCVKDLGKILGSLGSNVDVIRECLLDFINDKKWQHFPIGLWGIAEGWKNHPQTIQILHEIVLNESNQDFRQDAIEVLVDYFYNDHKTLNILRDRLTNDANYEVRKAATNALADKFKDDPQILPMLLRSNAISTLDQYFHDDPRTLPLARELAIFASNKDTRSAAIRVLGNYSHDPQSFLLVCDRCINDSEEEVRSSAVYSLAFNFQNESKSLQLVQDRAINDPHWKVRSAAVNALAVNASKVPQAFSLIYKCALKDDHENVRSAAFRALATNFIDEKNTLPFLLDNAVNEAHDGVRHSIILELENYCNKDSRIKPLLINRAIKDKFAFVRVTAFSLLARYFKDDPNTLSILQDRAKNDSDTHVRSEAISALVRYFKHDPHTFKLLCERALLDESPLFDDQPSHYSHEVREIAILALAYHFPTHPDTISLLINRIENDPTPWLRERAKELLKQITETTKKE